MPQATINGCRLFYEAAGEGSTAVYVHGGFAGLDTVLRSPEASGWSWEHDFATACYFVSYDRRGCARSESPLDGYDHITQARDLAGLLDYLQLDRAHIIGSSAGGPIAFTFAALYPARMRSLILTGTAMDLFPVGEPGSEAVRRQLVVLERDGAEAAFDQRPAGVEVSFNELWDEPEAQARGQLDAYRARVQSNHDQARGLPKALRVHYYATELRSMQAYMTTIGSAFAKAVTTPSYVLHGSRDQMVPVVDAEHLARAIPGARLEVLEGGSHSLMIRSAEARQRVITWMQRIDGGIQLPA